MARPPLGSGARFAALQGKLANQGVRDPAALAASIGRKRYGNSLFNKLASKGRKRKRRPKRIPPRHPMR